MSVRFPNRVEESGTYNGTSVSLSAVPALGMRDCATAATAGDLADGDRVGVALVAAADQDRWAVWSATYRAATDTLDCDDEETVSASPLTTGEAVNITLCVTAQTLDWYLNGVPVSYFDGPDYWTIPPGTDLTWNAAESTYDFSGGSSSVMLTPAGTWASGYRPTQLAIEVFIPAGSNAGDSEYTEVRIATGVDPYSPIEEFSVYIGAGVLVGAWNAVTVALSPTADISALFVNAGDPYMSAGVRFRRISLTP